MILRTSKASGITPWKKCYSLLRWPCLLQDVPNRRLLFKQTGSSSTKGNHHPSFLRFWNWAEEIPFMQLKFVAACENVVKTETQQTFANGLLGFITLGIYTPLEARIAHNNCMSVYRYKQLYLHCSLLYFCGFLPAVLPWSASSEGVK